MAARLAMCSGKIRMILLMIEILHDLIYQNHRNYGRSRSRFISSTIVYLSGVQSSTTAQVALATNTSGQPSLEP